MRPHPDDKYGWLRAALTLLLTLGPASFARAGVAPPDCTPLAGKTIRWIVPSQPGGGYDAYTRLIQPFLERLLAAQVLVENRPDAGGIVAAIAIRDAPADGTTLGIINASGLIAAHAIEAQIAPDPTRDFTLLGQVARNHMMVFTGRDSELKDIYGLLLLAQSRPIIIGVRDAGSSSFYAAPVLADLIGIDYALVSGYVGSPARTLALMRGEIDIFAGNLDSLIGQVQAGELVPLLQLTGATAQDGPEVPLLGGAAGIASQRAAATSRTPAQAEQLANDLAAVLGAGRLVVAPPRLPPALASCLERSLAEVLQSTELLAAARKAQLSIDYLDSAAVYRSLQAGAAGVDKFRPLIQQAIEQARE